MDNLKTVIEKKIKMSGSATVADFVKKTGFSRTYIHRVFKRLVDEGQIAKIGRTKTARYVLPNIALKELNSNPSIDIRLKNVSLNEDSVLKRIKIESGVFNDLGGDVSKIIDYAFTEMMNNAIEHSKAKDIRLRMTKDKNRVIFDVYDNGIGIFNNLMKERGLKSALEAVQDLLKGKQTTMPSAHSGEGIFFTSRLADKMIIFGGSYKLIYDNIIGDIFLEKSVRRMGTRVYFEIASQTKKKVLDIFKDYTDKETFQFNKTEVKIKLYKIDSEYISRSQARRILAGIDKFNNIVLDFDKVKTVGQGFADEIFRIWAHNNPKINIVYINANEEVEFMIKRAIENE
jgi:hypothetical protein